MGLFRRPKVAPEDLAALQDWVSSHRGVEAFVEPQTSVTPTTVVLVAGDGEFIRRRVKSPQGAADFARKAGIPIYDTNRVGLPQRMRDYAVRQQSGRGGGPSGTSVRTGRELDAISVIAAAASLPIPGADVNRDDLLALLRAARSKSHPDRTGGDRAAWDAVEDAARALGLR